MFWIKRLDTICLTGKLLYSGLKKPSNWNQTINISKPKIQLENLNQFKKLHVWANATFRTQRILVNVTRTIFVGNIKRHCLAKFGKLKKTRLIESTSKKYNIQIKKRLNQATVCQINQIQTKINRWYVLANLSKRAHCDLDKISTAMLTFGELWFEKVQILIFLTYQAHTNFAGIATHADTLNGPLRL